MESASVSLLDVINEFEALGFTSQFVPEAGGVLHCLVCNSHVPAEDVTVSHLRRLEGQSDPDDMAAVAALVCPVCASKGTVALKYGPEASLEDADVLRCFERNHPDI